MNILIAGASGFIGTELTNVLAQSHHVTVLGRDKDRLERSFPKTIEKLTWEELASHNARRYDIVINLSGSNIGAKRWSDPIKKELIESRTLTNKQLIDWLITQQAYPHYYCANAVGIYGAQNMSRDFLDEDCLINADSTSDFLKQIGIAWEQSLKPALDRGIKVTTLRFGVVLKKGQGMLKKLELPFGLGLGSVLGSGQQTISWVHYQDLVSAVLFLVQHQEVTGPVNITAPHPITQKRFATDFASILGRPLFLKMPSVVIKLLFGDMGDYLLLKGQKVVPKRLTELGFRFSYPDLATALKQEYQE